jgi:hypothetical protein
MRGWACLWDGGDWKYVYNLVKETFGKLPVGRFAGRITSQNTKEQECRNLTMYVQAV